MPDDPQILNGLGVEVEIRAWRGTGNTYRATFTNADGSPLDLSNLDVILTVVDRPGGTVKHTQTNTPATPHENAAGGTTLLNIPGSAFAGLTEQRQYTWKHQIVTRDRTTDEKQLHFYGDLRVFPPVSPV